MEIDLVFQHFIFMLRCLRKILLSLWRLPFGKHFSVNLFAQREDTRGAVHSTSKAMVDLDIARKSGWISNIKLYL
jgi:hypothetical protein